MSQDEGSADIQRVVRQIEAAMEQVPFARWLGLRLTGIEGDRVSISFEMRPEFVGNPYKQALHGGVISSVLDTVGGFAAILGLMTRSLDVDDDSLASTWVGTIDMRTDFLRPAIGDHFTAFAYPLRVGRRLVVTRMELHRAEGELIAVGTGTYVVP
jgi:uncharacterized protein (TIGR00369 family)